MLVRLLLSLLLVLTPTLAQACGPFPFHPFYSPPTIVKEVVVEKEVVPIFATLFVPAYGVGYPAPPPQPAAAAPVAPPVTQTTTSCEQRAADLERRLADLERRLAAGPGVGAPSAVAPVLPAAPGKDALSIFAARCASCHEAGVASAKGGGFVLLSQGKLAQLTDRQLRKVGTMTYSGQMPKGGPQLTDEETSIVQGWLNSQK